MWKVFGEVLILQGGSELKVLKDQNVDDQLLREFQEAFPGHESDLGLILDGKHKKVIEELSNMGGISSINYANLRNWQEQNDLGAPLTLKYLVRQNPKQIKELVKFIIELSLHRSEKLALMESLRDDISVLKLIKAYHKLERFPVNKTYGRTRWVSDGVTAYNMRWLRYAYLSHRIEEFQLLHRDAVWIDIGSFYGGLQSIVYQSFADLRVILVDFHHQLFRSYVFLKSTYPKATHILGYDGKTEIPPGAFVYVPVQNFSALASLKVDLVTNFFSFGEMPRSVFEEYMRSEVLQSSKLLYTVNRFVSSPFFERTYTNDLNVLDYKIIGKQIKYFDVFPMHHYQTTKREFLGHVRFRNTSSSYFEMICQRYDV